MERLKVKFALLVIFIMWVYLIVLDLPYMIHAYLYDKSSSTEHKEGKLHSILLGQDLYVNTQLGGYFRTTISSELGHQSKRSRSGRLAASVVDWLFELAGDGPNHCVNAIEDEDKHWFDAGFAFKGFTLWCIPRVLILMLLIGVI